MVQVINLGPSRGALQASQLGQGLQSLGQGLGAFYNNYTANKEFDALENNPELQNAPFSERMEAAERVMRKHGKLGEKIFGQKMQIEQQKQQEKSQKINSNLVNKMIKEEEITDKDLEGADPNLMIAAHKARQPKNPIGGLPGQAVPPEQAAKMDEIEKNNPNFTSEQLRSEMDRQGIYPSYSKPRVEDRKKQEELNVKKTAKTQSDLSKEVGPLKQKIIERANAARESIANKENLMDLVDKGNLTDPTVAAFLDNLPFNMGKRFLSDDTIEYKGGLVDNFRDLKTIFNGPARVKEIEIMEQKIPDIYLSDSQKKQLLKSRIDVSKVDIAREEAAAEIEEEMPNVSALQFNLELEKRTKEKMDAIGKFVIGEQRAVIDAAERMKSLPLNINDPDQKQIIQQIVLEANPGADVTKLTDAQIKKSSELAKKKGYHW